MRSVIKVVCALFTAAFVAGTAATQERRIALLIGNEAYVDSVGRLDNPHEDVDRIAVSLTQADFAPDDVIVVKDAGQRAMLEAVAAFSAKLREAGGEGVGFFYYSGHGASAESAGQRENYLVPSDADIETADQLALAGVPLTSIIKSLSAIEAKSIFIISDACRNTLPISTGAKALGGAGDKGFAPTPVRPGLFIAYATADGATAPDDGVFAAAIANQIAVPGQRATRAFELAFRQVVETRPGTALPFVSPGLTQDFCFVSCPDEAPVTVMGPSDASPQELSAWRVALQADTKEAYTDFADAYPDTFLGGEARAMAVLRPTAEERAEAKQVGGDSGGEAVDRALTAIEELTASIAGLARLGGVIDSPESITDFVNNARVYERRGDTLNARKMYERAIAMGADFVDVHYAYVAILKAQEGLIGAREIYADLARSNPDNSGAQLAHASVLPGEAREAKLEALDASDYGPAAYELARLYSLDRLGAQTTSDKRAEERWLAAFRNADAAGDVERRFLDKALLSEWRAEAERKWVAYAANASAPEITFTPSSSSSGWTIRAMPTEPSIAILYKTESQSDYRPTGKGMTTDPRTGDPMPNMTINLPLGSEPQTILVKYLDRNGNEQGPFEYAFDPDVRFVESAKAILEMTKFSWVSGRRWDDKNLIYFTNLMTSACGLDGISYGFSETDLGKTWPVPACDENNPGAIGENDQIYLETDESPEAVFIQLTFKDGTQTPVERIPVRFN